MNLRCKRHDVKESQRDRASRCPAAPSQKHCTHQQHRHGRDQHDRKNGRDPSAVAAALRVHGQDQDENCQSGERIDEVGRRNDEISSRHSFHAASGRRNRRRRRNSAPSNKLTWTNSQKGMANAAWRKAMWKKIGGRCHQKHGTGWQFTASNVPNWPKASHTFSTGSTSTVMIGDNRSRACSVDAGPNVSGSTTSGRSARIIAMLKNCR
jgi:hypothetical protein